MANGFVSAIFIKTLNCVGELLDRHLNTEAIYHTLCSFLTDHTGV